MSVVSVWVCIYMYVHLHAIFFNGGGTLYINTQIDEGIS